MSVFLIIGCTDNVEFMQSPGQDPQSPQQLQQEDPVICLGKGQGYWRNWSNHYTEEEFEELLDGTIAESVEEAEEIFSARPRGGQLVVVMRWMLLANQLSINLTGSDLPNADEVNLSPDCVAYEGGPVLSDLITEAIAIHEDPDAFSRQEIELVKDELELFTVIRDEEDENDEDEDDEDEDEEDENNEE